MQKFNKNLIIATFSIAILIGLVLFGFLREKENYIDYELYRSILQNGMINKAIIDDEYVTLHTSNGKYKIVKDVIDSKELYKYTYVELNKGDDYTELLVDIIVLSMLVFAILVILRLVKRDRDLQKEKIEKESKFKEQISMIQKQAFEKNQVESSSEITPSISNVTFDDVAGINDVKEELTEIIDFLKNPKKYSDFGVKLPKGVLLIGQPGVGKTLIAKAVAGEANVPFFYQSGASFVQIYVGVGAKRVRELFAKAKEKSPSIIFIDEIDAVGKSRGNFRNDERESTLNQLLTEMDGFEDSSGVIVIGATNQVDMLDDALLRAGRFDRRVHVSLPTYEERLSILKIYLKNKKHSVDIEELAKMTVGFNGAGLSSFVNEAGIYALNQNKEEITKEDFLAVLDKVIFGKKRAISFNNNQRDILATYQSAKAIVAYWFDIEFEKISIINNNFKDFDKELLSKTEMMNKIKLYLAGVSAYDLKYSERFSNSKEDLEFAKNMANKMINEYGMGKKIIPDSLDASEILENALRENREFLSTMDIALEKIETILIERESILFEEVKEIVSNPY